MRADRDLIGDFQGIVSFVEAKGSSTSTNLEMKDKAEMKAYLSLIENSLVPSELNMLRWKKDWAVRTRQHYGCQFPVPLNLVLSYRRLWKVCGKSVDNLREMGGITRQKKRFLKNLGGDVKPSLKNLEITNSS